MTYNPLRGQALDRKVVTLGQFAGLSNRVIDRGRFEARIIAQKYRGIEVADIGLSLSWQIKFPRRSTYGEAFNALLSLAGVSWKVTNKLRAATIHIMEADQLRLQGSSNGSMFVFFHVTRNEPLVDSIDNTRVTLAKSESPATAWDYICFAVTDPDRFEKKLFVAVGDRVPWSMPDDPTHAPTLFLENSRLTLAPLPKAAKPNGIAFHHMAVTPLSFD